MEFIKVKDNEHLIKNTKSNFIVNTNKSEYDEYIARRKLKQSEKQKVENIERDISTLRNEITEIKDMLRSLVNGN
jgi:glutamyl-tRNA reductase|tara:strand:+ start:250 stop:474 length:225 start_codon:yes stop_codon:yes gene_type:complete